MHGTSGGHHRRGAPAPAFTAPPSRRGPPDEVIARALATGKVVLQNSGLSQVPPSVFTAGAAVDAWWTVEPLRLLDFTGNHIEDIPDLSQFFETLSTVRFGSNRISRAPAHLAGLTILKLLDLSKNPIAELPPALLCMPSLVELDLRGVRLPSLPSGGFASMASLEILRLSDGCLRSLPEDIGNAPRLLELEVMNNELVALPHSLGGAARLKTLNASRNRLVSCPSLEGCVSLVVVDLRQNKLRQAPYLPAGDALREVYVGINVIEAVDPACLARPGITTLDLSSNKLETLPRELRALRALHTLDVRDNEIPELPPWLGFMPALVRLSVQGNPLRSLKRSLLGTAAGFDDGGAGATEALKTYLRSRADEADAAYEEEAVEAAGAGLGMRRGLGGAAGAAAAASRASAAAAAAGEAPMVFELLTTTTLDGAAVRGRSPAACAAAAQAAWVSATREAASGGKLAAVPFFADGPADGGHAAGAGAGAGVGVGRGRGAAGGIGFGRAAAESAAARAGTEIVGQLAMLSLAALDGGPLQLLRRLRVLDLTNQAIGARGGLPAGLLTACPQLESIILARNGLVAIPDALLEGAAAAAAFAAPAPAYSARGSDGSPGISLRELVLSGNPGIGAAMRGRPLDVAALPPSLQSLDLSGCALRVLPAGLPYLPSIRTLLLSDNGIVFPPASLDPGSAAAARGGFADDGGALFLRSAVHVDLSSNQLTALPLSLAASRTLETLDVRHNEIGMLAPRIAAIPTLTSLCIEGNPQRVVRPAVADRGPAAVVAFLRDRLRADGVGHADHADNAGAADARGGGRGGVTADDMTGHRPSRVAHAPPADVRGRYADGADPERDESARHHDAAAPFDGRYAPARPADEDAPAAAPEHRPGRRALPAPGASGGAYAGPPAAAPEPRKGGRRILPVPGEGGGGGYGGTHAYAAGDAYAAGGANAGSHDDHRAPPSSHYDYEPKYDAAPSSRDHRDPPYAAAPARDAGFAGPAPASTGHGYADGGHPHAAAGGPWDDRHSAYGGPPAAAPEPRKGGRRILPIPGEGGGGGYGGTHAYAAGDAYAAGSAYAGSHDDRRAPPASHYDYEPSGGHRGAATHDAASGPFAAPSSARSSGPAAAAVAPASGPAGELASIRSQIAALEAELLAAGTVGPLPGALRRKITVLRVQEGRLV